MPVLSSPTTSVVGTTDLGRMAAFFSVFGAQPRRLPPVSRDSARALYGHDSELRQLLLTEPGTGTTIRLVETPLAAPAFEPLRSGAYGIDYYTRDLELTLDMLERVGRGPVSPLVVYGVPGNRTHELLTFGPDELPVFLTDVRITDSPWRTLLDDDPLRTHSELLMQVYVTESPDTERRFWLGEAGLLNAYPDASEYGDSEQTEWNDEMQRLMFTPRNTPLDGINVTGTDRNHKMELLSYPQETVTPRESWPLRAGFFGGGFEVEDLEQTMAALPSATFGDIATADQGTGEQRVVSGCSPASIRFELWEAIAIPNGG
jgi:hypothetical protein